MQHAASRLLRSIDVSSLVVVGGAIVLLALARARLRLAAAAAALMVGATGTAEGLKHVLPRPELTGPDRLPIPSYPSGHTTVAASLALGLVLVLPGRWRAPAALAGTAYASAVGVATVTAGWHRPSDVVGGFLVTVAWAAVIGAVLVARARVTTAAPVDRRAARRSAHVVVAVLALAAVLVGALGVAVAGMVKSLSDRNLRTLPVGAAYVGSVGVIVAAGAALVAVFLAALGGAVLDRGPPEARAARTEGPRPKLILKD